MKSIVAGLFAFTLLAPALQPVGGGPRQGSSLAYISVQKILSESNDAKAASKKLEDLRQAKSKDIAARQKALEATRLELLNAGGVFSTSKRARLKTQEGQQQTELQHASQQAQTDFQTLQRELQGDIRREFGMIVADIAKAKGIQLVLNSDTAVVWASTGTDLTAEVLERLNAAAQKRSTK